MFTSDYFSIPGGASAYQVGAVLGAITAFGPVGTIIGGGGGTSTNGSYTPSNYYKDSDWSWSISQGNDAGGIKAIRFDWGTSVFVFQFLFDTPIPKVNTQVLTLTMRFTWFRV
jgi:hypothetical protein